MATLVAGSYERFLFGFSFREVDKAAAGAEHPRGELQRCFIQAAHQGVVKCLAGAGQYAASGGADDLANKDLGFLMNPAEGAVTAAAFFVPAGAYTPTHLLTGSADGALSVWVAGGGWQALKTLRGHRKEVTGIAVHPSGKLALTVSRDGTLRMWNLVKGRCTYTTRLPAPADAVTFSPSGDRYALLLGDAVAVHSTAGEGGGALATLAHPRRALCLAFCGAGGGRLATGCEDGSLRMWDAVSGAELCCAARAHATRVRALAALPAAGAGAGSDAGGQQDGRVLVATGSSDGVVKVWDLTLVDRSSGGSGTAECLAQAETRARLTCLAALDSADAMQRGLKEAAAAPRRAAEQAAVAAPAGAAQGEGPRAPKRPRAAGGGGPAAAPQLERAQQRGKQQEQQGRPQPRRQQQQQQQQQQQKQHKQHKQHKQKQKGEEHDHREGSGVVVRDGVVEFLDDEAGQARAKKKKQSVKQRAKAAAQRGKQRRPARLPGPSG
eukprot:scaffold9.g3281.t1